MKSFKQFESTPAALRSDCFMVLPHSKPKDMTDITSSNEINLLPTTNMYTVKDELASDHTHERISSPLDARLRRLRANDRERRRIQSINGAMEALRRVIPDTRNNRKVTKLQLLKLAQDYIRYLSEVLQTSTNNPIQTAYRLTASTPINIDSYGCYQPTACEHFVTGCFSH